MSLSRPPSPDTKHLPLPASARRHQDSTASPFKFSLSLGAMFFSLSGFALLAVVLCSFVGARSVPDGQVGPGCRMSWMYPSYFRFSLDRSHSSLAGKYSLYLYREHDWDRSTQVNQSLLPILLSFLFGLTNSQSFLHKCSLSDSQSSSSLETPVPSARSAPSHRRPLTNSISHPE
jgi:hypothetical protein